MQKHVMKLFSQPTADWFSDTFGMPTRVQEEAWAAIAKDKDVLVSAPTGTGKTLSAFLIFIDRLNALAAGGDLKEELYLLYVSPLKSLAGDIRENLRRPLDGIPKKAGQPEIVAAMRTGDTPQKERQRMIKHPPHILITTPESLYLMLTSKGGQEILRTVRAVILDELHAMIDTKRGAHLMLSIARLEKLSGRKLQRIGLSATIAPLELAAEYLSPESAVIAAPPMKKQVKIEIVGTVPFGEKRKDPLWEELAKIVYEQCLSYKSVIAFSEGRRDAEKLASYVNLLGGEDFARVHHGSLSKEQRMEAEEALRKGKLRLLCATSSMELGIDVGEIDRVLQIGCPRTVSSTMQRLGRAGHNPGKVSVMTMYPRTAPESVYCGITAEIARQGGVEHAAPPRAPQADLLRPPPPSGQQDAVVIQIFPGSCPEALQQAGHGQSGPLLPPDVQNDVPGVHHQGAVAQLQSLVHIVGDHKGGDPVLRYHLPGDPQHLFGGAGVQGGGVLIQQQQLWGDQRSHEQGEGLPLPAGQQPHRLPHPPGPSPVWPAGPGTGPGPPCWCG